LTTVLQSENFFFGTGGQNYFMSETSKVEWYTAIPSASETADREKSTSHEKSKKEQTLIEKIRAFRHKMPLAIRLPLAIVFLVLGILGLFLPVLQGGLFLFIAFWLLFPDQTEKLWAGIKAWFTKNKKKS
jgi:hypothetical protein